MSGGHLAPDAHIAPDVVDTGRRLQGFCRTVIGEREFDAHPLCLSVHTEIPALVHEYATRTPTWMRLLEPLAWYMTDQTEVL